MLVCPERKIIFFKPLKCAGSSVEHALLNFCSPGALCTGSKGEYQQQNNLIPGSNPPAYLFTQHQTPAAFFSKVLHPNFYDDYQKITITRNPWDALVSYYWWVVRNKGKDFVNPAYRQYIVDNIISRNDSSAAVKNKFERVLTIAQDYSGLGIARQVGLEGTISSPLILFSLVNSSFLHESIDHYLTYENIELEYLSFCKNMSFAHAPLPRHKMQHRPHNRNNSEYFSEWMKGEIDYYFRDYIAKFEYRFECNGA